MAFGARIADTTSDEELARRARRGDQQAFGELVSRYQRPLMAKALRSTRHVEDADDLVQETFLKAWDALARLEDPTRFGGWLFRILANLAADRGRKLGREVALDDEGPEPESEGPAPDARLLKGELARALREALDAIPEGRQREVFTLRFVEGLPIAEISARLGVHSGTVKTHLFRLTRELKRRVGREEETTR